MANTSNAVEHYPKGYPRLASFANSDDTFAVIPRHGRTSYRVLLHLDNKLTELEKEIDELDKKDATDKIMEKRLRRYENYDGYNDEQDKLISKSEAVYSRFGILVPIKIRAKRTDVIASGHYLERRRPPRTEKSTKKYRSFLDMDLE